MKKNNVLIIALVVILIICSIILGLLKSFEDSNNTVVNKNDYLLLSCDSKTVKINEKVNCTLKGVSKKYEVSAIGSTIDSDLNLELVDVVTSTEFEGDGELGDVDLYTDVNKKDEFDILTFTVKLINDNVDSVDINITSNSFFDENYKEHVLDDIKKTIKVVR